VLVCETLQADLPSARRAELHAQVARILERRGLAGLVVRAHHALLGVPALDAAAAIEVARRAASLASSQLDFEGAADLLTRAADLLPPGDAASRCDLGIEMAVSRFRNGEPEAGLEACRQAMALARSLRDPERLARAALALGTEVRAGRVDPEL